MQTRSAAPISRISRNTRGAGGMTLIEVMVAALILLVVMAGMVPLFLTGLSQASGLRLKSLASNIAREKMEMVRQLDYREIYSEANRLADPTLGTRTLENLFGTSVTVRDVAFAVQYVVNLANYEQGRLKEVTVNVSWAAPPRVSPASITTLIHQQYLGPRGNRLTLTPSLGDPLGTPFPLLAGNTKARFYIAQADWNLVFFNLNQANPTLRDVYMRLAVFDDDGQSIPLGPPATDYKIGKSQVRYSRGTDGAIDAVWFEYDFNANDIPDGYWEMQAVAYNTYNEPGNIWRLRTRIEKGPPAAPTGLVASSQSDNRTIVLLWAGGPERDRSHYALERRRWDPVALAWLPWVTVASGLAPNQSSYADVGNVGAGQDPWGTPATQNRYQYSLKAVDICQPGLNGPPTQVEAYIPPLTTTTTLTTSTSSTTTTTSAGTTTTTAVYSVNIQNNTGTSYAVVIKNSSGSTVYSGTVKKNKTLTVSGLVNGSYLITATAAGKPTLTQSFSLPAQAGAVVLWIL